MDQINLVPVWSKTKFYGRARSRANIPTGPTSGPHHNVWSINRPNLYHCQRGNVETMIGGRNLGVAG